MFTLQPVRGIMCLITSIAKHSSVLTTHTEQSLLYRGIKHPWDSGKLMLSSVHSPFCSKDIYLKAKCLIRKWCDIVELGFCLPAVLTWILTSPNVEDLNDYNASFSQTTNNCEGSSFPPSLLATRSRGERDGTAERFRGAGTEIALQKTDFRESA